ncbi:MAG: DNA alkylation response protein, partial [Candidatus Binatia bacterium]
LNAIWEGAGNVICLDILRTLRREPEAGAALGAEFGAVAGQDRRFDAALQAHMQTFPRLPDEAQARWYAESLATLLTASVLMRAAPGPVADAYVALRLSERRGRVAGAVGGIDAAPLLA